MHRESNVSSSDQLWSRCLLQVSSPPPMCADISVWLKFASALNYLSSTPSSFVQNAVFPNTTILKKPLSWGVRKWFNIGCRLKSCSLAKVWHSCLLLLLQWWALARNGWEPFEHWSGHMVCQIQWFAAGLLLCRIVADVLGSLSYSWQAVSHAWQSDVPD